MDCPAAMPGSDLTEVLGWSVEGPSCDWGVQADWFFLLSLLFWADVLDIPISVLTLAGGVFPSPALFTSTIDSPLRELLVVVVPTWGTRMISYLLPSELKEALAFGTLGIGRFARFFVSVLVELFKSELERERCSNDEVSEDATERGGEARMSGWVIWVFGIQWSMVKE
jgi:hypothetical protein